MPDPAEAPVLSVAELPHALSDGAQFTERLGGRRPAVFLDYDGTLTPIVDRPEEAVISDRMRDAVHRLAERCPVCVVSGRDRSVVQRLMGIDTLVVAGGHGFDIAGDGAVDLAGVGVGDTAGDGAVDTAGDGVVRGTGSVRLDASAGFEDLLCVVSERLRTQVGEIPGAVVEPKKASVAVHYRLVAEPRRPQVRAVVDELVAEFPDRLKITPGKMVLEIQPRVDWDKGKAVLHLLRTLGLDIPDVVPVYLGDDITDEDAFRALSGGDAGRRAGRGIGIVVAASNEATERNRRTAADFVLHSIGEVEQFLRTLAC